MPGEVKYQVFVSSTYEDLKTERNRVIQGILEMGHIPVGMEMFSAGDDEQWEIIARHIRESDYYVVIVGHRYGSTTGGISYTRKEYEYAIAAGVPVIGFVLDDSAPWIPEFVDKDVDDVRDLKAFKSLVREKPVGFWLNADDLYGKASVALVKAIAAKPRVGWVRTPVATSGETAAELTRLSAENAVLRDQLADQHGEKEVQEGFDADVEILRRNKRKINLRFLHRDLDWEEGDELSLKFIFEIVSPMMMVEYSIKSLSGLVALHAVKDGDDRRPITMPHNVMADIMTDLMAFDLVEPSDRKHAVSDDGQYWALTPRGRQLAKYLNKRRLMATRRAVLDDSGSDG